MVAYNNRRMPDQVRRLKVFICHSSGDKPLVRQLYKQLKRDGFLPWLDEEDLLPGHDWQGEIRKALRAADFVVVCLSRGSINREGYVQKEIRIALDIADEKPDGLIFLIPAWLDDCPVPERLSRCHWVDLAAAGGYERLKQSLQTIGRVLPAATPKRKLHESRGSVRTKDAYCQDTRLQLALSVARVSALVQVDASKTPFQTVPDGLFLRAFNDNRVGISDEQMAFFKARLKDFLPEVGSTIDGIAEDSSQFIGDVARLVWLAEEAI